MDIDLKIHKTYPFSVKVIVFELRKMLEHYEKMEAMETPEGPDEAVRWANEKMKLHLKMNTMVEHKNVILQYVGSIRLGRSLGLETIV